MTSDWLVKTKWYNWKELYSATKNWQHIRSAHKILIIYKNWPQRRIQSDEDQEKRQMKGGIQNKI